MILSNVWSEVVEKAQTQEHATSHGYMAAGDQTFLHQSNKRKDLKLHQMQQGRASVTE